MSGIEIVATDVLAALVAERGQLVTDGGTGTELFARGLSTGDAPERMNLDRPDVVEGLHRSYINAGADIVLTNTFGANRHRLALHDLEHSVIKINCSAASLARRVADRAGRKVLVAGSMGPAGKLLAPLGDLGPDDAADSFAEQARGLAEGGADVLWVETMSALDEAEAAILGARSVSELPIVVTMSFDTAGCTMMGVTGTHAGTRLAELGVAGVGANCGNNLADTEAALSQIRAAVSGVVVISKANAGIPRWHGTELTYEGSPEVMAAHAQRMRTQGVTVIGGCCGNTPEHIAAIRAVLDETIDVPDIAQNSGHTTAREESAQTATADRRANPRRTGRQRRRPTRP